MHKILRLLRDIEAEVNYKVFVSKKMIAQKWKKSKRMEVKNKPRHKIIFRKTIK